MQQTRTELCSRSPRQGRSSAVARRGLKGASAAAWTEHSCCSRRGRSFAVARSTIIYATPETKTKAISLQTAAVATGCYAIDSCSADQGRVMAAVSVCLWLLFGLWPVGVCYLQAEAYVEMGFFLFYQDTRRIIDERRVFAITRRYRRKPSTHIFAVLIGEAGSIH